VCGRKSSELARDIYESITAKTQACPWDIVERLETEENLAAYLDSTLEEGDSALVAAALGRHRARKDMTQIARDPAARASIRRFPQKAIPSSPRFLRVVRVLGLRLHASPVEARPPEVLVQFQYAVVIEKGATSYGAYVPDLSGCIAVGETRDEVVHLIQEALEFHIEGLREYGLPVPPPRRPSSWSK